VKLAIVITEKSMTAFYHTFSSFLYNRIYLKTTWIQNFRELSPADKLASISTAVGISGSVTLVVSYVLSTDFVQKKYIKYKLLNMHFPRPHHMDRVNLI